MHFTQPLWAVTAFTGDVSCLKSYWQIFPREDPIAKVVPSGMKSTVVRGKSATIVVSNLQI